MKIYTKGGDKGETSLVGGDRVRKDHENIAAYGDIDELNSFLGLLISHLSDAEKKSLELLKEIQNELFVIGSHLAVGEKKPSYELPKLSQDLTGILEKSIDEMEGQMKPLANFILPGGTKAASHAHCCRVIARRAERSMVSLKNCSPEALIFVNRLSDFFFVLARFDNFKHGQAEHIWKAR